MIEQRSEADRGMLAPGASSPPLLARLIAQLAMDAVRNTIKARDRILQAEKGSMLDLASVLEVDKEKLVKDAAAEAAVRIDDRLSNITGGISDDVLVREAQAAAREVVREIIDSTKSAETVAV